MVLSSPLKIYHQHDNKAKDALESLQSLILSIFLEDESEGQALC